MVSTKHSTAQGRPVKAYLRARRLLYNSALPLPFSEATLAALLKLLRSLAYSLAAKAAGWGRKWCSGRVEPGLLNG